MSLVLTACAAQGDAGQGASAGNKGNLIGVSLYTNQVARFNFEEKKMKEVAAQNGDSVISNFANNNLETQLSQIQSMFQRGIKVLVLNQINSKAFAPIVSQAQQRGIKVIAYDEDVAGANVDYVVQRDNVEMGAVQAQSVIDHLPAGRVAKVAIIRGDPSTPAMVQMSESYDKLIGNNPKIEVVYDNTTPGWDQAAAQRNAEAALQKEPNIDAFLVMWDNGAQAVAQALKATGKQAGTVWSTGSDGSPASLAYIAQGWQGQTTWTAVDKQATNAMTIAHAFASGSEPPTPDSKTQAGVPVLHTPLSSVTKDNLCEFLTKSAPTGWVKQEQVFGSEGASTCGQ
ncbi:substrate-binding domain-containing protein [Kribbella caucasensis]|uniref:substrate-binding domain-containing protein n=1 Tax=Kribbella caucasensis TaxID=2512215 RepID=UPI001414D578|nr:substrate-binding domain-containing protein [Kribbella sp. VKM Ac-2527]